MCIFEYMKKLLIALFVCIPTIVNGGQVYVYDDRFYSYNITKVAEEISKRYYNHYKFDDQINNYLLNSIKNGYTVFGGKSINTRKTDSKFPAIKRNFKQKLVIKNKNKIVYKFLHYQEIILNPSDMSKGITHTWKNIDVVNYEGDLVTSITDDGNIHMNIKFDY